jgi:hypothetical protein
MSRIHFVATFAFAAAAIGSSAALAWDQNPFEQYFQRSDTVTLGAGDAKETNTVTHVIDPWPPYVGNRRIPGNGERMSDAVSRYRNALKPVPPRPVVIQLPNVTEFNSH